MVPTRIPQLPGENLQRLIARLVTEYGWVNVLSALAAVAHDQAPTSELECDHPLHVARYSLENLKSIVGKQR